jgi:hypothetical protein
MADLRQRAPWRRGLTAARLSRPVSCRRWEPAVRGAIREQEARRAQRFHVANDLRLVTEALQRLE